MEHAAISLCSKLLSFFFMILFLHDILTKFITSFIRSEVLGRSRRRLQRSASTHLLSRKPMMRSGLQRVDVEEDIEE